MIARSDVSANNTSVAAAITGIENKMTAGIEFNPSGSDRPDVGVRMCRSARSSTHHLASAGAWSAAAAQSTINSSVSGVGSG